jgi:DNA-binding CsgD family transcriptional regulator
MPIEGQQLKQVLERVASPSFAIDKGGTVKWQNAAAIELLGDVRGSSFTVAVAPSDLPGLSTRFTRRIANGGDSDFDATLVTSTGALAACGLSSTVLHRDGEVVGLFGVITRPPVHEHAPPVDPDRLTPRQHEVLRLLAGGATTEEMAQILHLSKETIRNHVQALLRRLDAKTRVEAVAVARRDSLLH